MIIRFEHARYTIRRPAAVRRALDVRQPATPAPPVEIARRDELTERQASQERSHDVERDVRDGALDLRAARPGRVADARRSRRRSRGVLDGDLDRDSSTSRATTGAKPSFAAAMESTPEPQPTSRRLPGSAPEQLEREPRRRMCTGAERPARVDHDRRPSAGASPTAARSRAGRPTPRWKSRHAVLPALCDVVAAALSNRARALLPLVRVGGDATPSRARPPRRPAGRVRAAARPFRLAARDDDAPQRKALLSFSKKPSSGL